MLSAEGSWRWESVYPGKSSAGLFGDAEGFYYVFYVPHRPGRGRASGLFWRQEPGEPLKGKRSCPGPVPLCWLLGEASAKDGETLFLHPRRGPR